MKVPRCFRFRPLGLLLLLFSMLFPVIPRGSVAADRKVGVVLLHGKWGSPDRNIDGLAQSLRSKGYMVLTPVMPWSRLRGYDAGYVEALGIVDRSVRELRKGGATLVVVAGHSMGANVSIGAAAYGQEPVDGVVAIAPGHAPELEGYRQKIAASLTEATEMVRSGRGGEQGSFLDLNAGRSSMLPMTAAVYVSYNDPDGMASMPRSASRVKQPVPLLWIIAGPEDVLYRQGIGYVFDRWPANPKNRYLLLQTTHLAAPDAAVGAIVEWLQAL